MTEISGSNGNTHVVLLNVKEDHEEVIHQHVPPTLSASASINQQDSLPDTFVPFLQKILAETVGTYLLIFAGCGAVAVNSQHDKVVTHPGVGIVWGLAVLVLIYSVGHISGAHFNPAVTIAFASCKRFPLKQVPAYILAQVIGSTLAAATLRFLFDLSNDVCSGKHDVFVGTLPSGSNLQSFVIEFIITFYLMLVICGVATDNRAVGEFAGLAVGSTILMNVILAGPVSGASMNPARSLGPAMVFSCYRGIWVYIVSPILGAVAGACVYNALRFTKPLGIVKSRSFGRNRGK